MSRKLQGRIPREAGAWGLLSEVLAGASQGALVVKNQSANAGDAPDVGTIPGSGRYPGGKHGNPLQYSCLENPMDRGAWWVPVHGVAESNMPV